MGWCVANGLRFGQFGGILETVGKNGRKFPLGQTSDLYEENFKKGDSNRGSAQP